MKRLMILLAIAIVSVTVMSCEKYEDGRPDRAVIREFDRMYPDAKDVEWEPEGGYWKVSFETGTAPGRVEREAWFDAEGNWLRTETEMFLSAVPQEIKDFLGNSEYGTSVIERDDVEFVETPESSYYRFTVSYGGVAVYVDVYENGIVTSGGLDW